LDDVLRENDARRPGAVRAPELSEQGYWQVYFDTNRLIRETFGEAGFPAPEQHYAIRNPVRAATA